MTRKQSSLNPEHKAWHEIRTFRDQRRSGPSSVRRRSPVLWVLGAVIAGGLGGGLLVDRWTNPVEPEPPSVALEHDQPDVPVLAKMQVAPPAPLDTLRQEPGDHDRHGGLAQTHGLIAAPVVAETPAPPPTPPAVPVAAVGGRPMIAVVLDDLGLNRPAARRAIALPGPLTLAFMTYAERLPDLATKARASGHETLVHVPMEPESGAEDPGPNALLTAHDSATLHERLTWGLNRFEGYVGINNHMGSRFTSQSEGMRTVFSQLRARGLLFLDSKTTAASVGRTLAEEYGVLYVARDVFLDNAYQSRQAIRRQLAQLERIAQRHGSAVGLGHPHRTTLEELAAWISRDARARICPGAGQHDRPLAQGQKALELSTVALAFAHVPLRAAKVIASSAARTRARALLQLS